MEVVVLMGGLGTRLGLVDRPKTLADVNGRPFFDWQLKILKRWGFRKFIFLVGYMSDAVKKHYGNGEKFGVEIQYSADGEKPLGTGGALKKAESLIKGDFLLMYGDSFMDIDYQELVYHYADIKNDNLLGMTAILRNQNALDKSNVEYKDNGRILYDKFNPTAKMEYIDYGVSIMAKEILRNIPVGVCFDIAELMNGASKEGKIFGHEVTRRFYEIGSPASLEEFRVYARQRFLQKRKAVFFDRDGVINEIIFNEETEQLDSPFDIADFCYKDGAADAMRELQDAGYLLFIVTNQPAAAKGNTTLKKLYALNRWLEKDLQRRGVKIEFINMCPHHPAGTARSKQKFLIRECDCRKPKSGLITDLLGVYGIDTENSFMVGDSYTDVSAAKGANIKSILLGDLKCDACSRLAGNKPDFIINDIAKLPIIIKGGVNNAE